jgi:hypothetical protein
MYSYSMSASRPELEYATALEVGAAWTERQNARSLQLRGGFVFLKVLHCCWHTATMGWLLFKTGRGSAGQMQRHKHSQADCHVIR